MSRTYIIEPSLILRTGHIKKCTELFTLESLKINKNTIVVVPIGAPEIFSKNSKIAVKKILPNSYEQILYDQKLYSNSLSLFMKVLFFYLPSGLKNNFIFFIGRIFWYLSNYRKMKIALQQLFVSEKISSRDNLILPNGDLLCSKSLIRIIKGIGKDNSPKLAIRFINVMENVGIPGLITKKSMLRNLRFLEKKKFHLRITAETQNYRLFLANYLMYSEICENPVLSKGIKLKKSNKIVIGFLGSARPDKGFEMLKIIIPITNSSNLENKVHFIVQESTRSWGNSYDETLNLLRQFPLTKILPGYISDQEMRETISLCTALVLPYNVGTYAFRGSAMLFDAADLNVPVIAPSGTGVGETIRRFGIGSTYSNIAEIPSIINSILELSQLEISKRFKNYNDFRRSALRKFLE